MADNITLNAGLGGDVVAADDIGSVKYQRVKIAHGADGSATDASTAAAFPVRPLGDYGFDLARGVLASGSVNHKFGRNTAVAAASREDIWTVGGSYNWLTAAAPLRIAAGGNAADTSTGTGARTVTVEGLSTAWTEISATLTLAGTSASAASTASFYRVNRAYVATCGTYTGNNTGDIVIETTAGTTVGGILATDGQTEQTMYTVPAGKTGYLVRAHANVSGNQAADLRLCQRRNADTVTAPFSAMRIIIAVDGIAGVWTRTFDAAITIPAKTDVWWDGQATGGQNTDVDAAYDLWLIAS